MLVLLRLLSFSGMMLASSAASADGIEWKVQPNFENDEAAFELSGVVCAGSGKTTQWCFAVNDEKKYIQHFSIEGRTIIPGDRLRLLDKETPTGSKFAEPDLEAAAYHEGFVYAVGSHGLSRKQNRFSASRFFIYRLPVDPKSGKPTFKLTRKAVVPQIERTNRLREIIKAADGLSSFAEMPLSENGANIEGMGLIGNDIYLGFRAPYTRAGAIVLQVAVSALFSSGPKVSVTHYLNLGVDYGIRDMARIDDRFLVLSGAAGSGDLTSAIWSWKPGEDPVLLLVLSGTKGNKAEGLLVLNADANKSVRVLVLFDSRKNGAPTEFTVSLR